MDSAQPHPHHHPHRHYTHGEDVANWVSHGLGAIAAVVGLVVLVMRAVEQDDSWNLFGFSVFGTTMVLLYSASTAYHLVPSWLISRKAYWQTYDQSAIYLLIAGSYTPFVLGNLRTPTGWWLLGFVWLAAVVGIFCEVTGRAQSMNFRLVIYVTMGWAAVLAGGAIFHAMPLEGLRLVVLGGVAYTSGLLFFLWRSLPYHHAIWHLFVIAGTAFHFGAVYCYVVPAVSGS